VTRRRFSARERAGLDSERSGFASSRLSGDSDKTTVDRRDDLVIGDALDDLDRDLTTIERQAQAIGFLLVSIAAGEIETLTSVGLTADAVAANLTVRLDVARQVYAVTIANQADTTDYYRPAAKLAETFEVSSYDAADAPRNLASATSELAVWVWAVTT
jgi:hypothetical protein